MIASSRKEMPSISPNPQNFLELKPERNSRWDISTESRVTLFVPKFRNPWLKRWLVPRLSNPEFRVHLDELGSRLWLHCDGQKTVRELAEGLSEQFQQPLDSLYDRMAQFCRRLETEGLLIMKTPEENRLGN